MARVHPRRIIDEHPDPSLFTGLSAFPLTPLKDDSLDEDAFIGLIERLVLAGVDSITALGSTGSYAYLDTDERARVAQLSVETALTSPSSSESVRCGRETFWPMSPPPKRPERRGCCWHR